MTQMTKQRAIEMIAKPFAIIFARIEVKDKDQ